MTDRLESPPNVLRPHRPTGLLTILLVEDCPADLRLTAEWLKQEVPVPPVVLSATSVAEAGAVLATCLVDCVVLDLGLPDATGTEALAAVVEAAHAAPVVVLTARDDDALDLRLLHLGAADFVPKGPSQGELLRRTVRYAVERSRAERARRDSEERFRVAFEDGPVGTGMIRFDGQFSRANRALCRFLAASEAELQTLRLGEFLHPDDRAGYDSDLAALRDGITHHAEAERRFVRADQRLVWARLHLSAVSGPDGGPAYGIVQVEDITDQRLREEELLHRALHDPLTGLANRRLILERLDGSLQRAARGGGAVAVLYCDLDRFRDVNERLGHDEADRLLVAAAHSLRKVVRPGDTVGRMGGDEFVMICEDIAGEAEAVVLGERLLRCLEQVSIGGMDVSASVGIALGKAGSDPTTLLRDADSAMYTAKRAGRAQVVAAYGPGPGRASGGASANSPEVLNPPSGRQL